MRFFLLALLATCATAVQVQQQDLQVVAGPVTGGNDFGRSAYRFARRNLGHMVRRRVANLKSIARTLTMFSKALLKIKASPLSTVGHYREKFVLAWKKYKLYGRAAGTTRHRIKFWRRDARLRIKMAKKAQGRIAVFYKKQSMAKSDARRNHALLIQRHRQNQLRRFIIRNIHDLYHRRTHVRHFLRRSLYFFRNGRLGNVKIEQIAGVLHRNGIKFYNYKGVYGVRRLAPSQRAAKRKARKAKRAKKTVQKIRGKKRTR